MNTRTRLKGLEAQLSDRSGSCLMIAHVSSDGVKSSPRCPQGKELSEDLHECEDCEVKLSKRKRIVINHVPADYRRPPSVQSARASEEEDME